MTIFGNLSGTFKNLFSIGKNNKILIGNDSGNLTFDVNDAEALRIETDGTLKVSTTDYENLVTADDDIPNKKFVSDITDNLKTIQNYADSSGIISGGAITEGTNAGTFKVAALTAFLRSTDSEIGDLVGVSLSEQDNQTITAADTYYIITLNYNGGSPTISLSTSNPYDADKRNIPIGQVMKTSGNTVHYISGGYDFQDGVKKLHERAKLLRKLELATGSTIAYSGTNNFTMTAGIVFGGLNKFTVSSYNSATTTFIPIYGDGSTGFTEGTARNTIDYTKYDDGSGTLANITNSKYGCHWVYRHIDDGHVFVVYGYCNDLLSVAESTGAPAIPDYLTNFGVLVGKIIAPQAGGSFATIQLVTDTFFSGTTVSDHNGLSSLQGGTADEYYHLTSNQYTNNAYLNQENVFTQLQTITIADDVNDVGLVINQNDVTNNPNALNVINTGSGDSLNINTIDFVVKDEGNVGIGSSNPKEKLEVVGDIISKGTLWTSRTSASDNDWLDVTYGNNLFVAVAESGTGDRVMTSPDGINWTSRTSATDNDWRSVTYGNGLFVAVASSGTDNRVMTSSDGINWTSRTSAADNSWYSITYGNGLFVAVAGTGTNDRVMTSSDGINWTSRTSAADNNWIDVVYGNGLFVAVAFSGADNRVMTSPDGINWTSRTSAADNVWHGVTYGNGLFVAVSSTGTNDRVMTSPDGITWTSRTPSSNNDWQSVIYGNGLFVAVAYTGTSNRVMTSSDGINWTSRTSAADNGWLNVVYGNGLFVAVSSTGTGNRVMTSGKSDVSIIPHNNKYNGGITVTGAVSSSAANITTSSDNIDVGGINTLFVVPASGNLTIGGFTGGVLGQHLIVISKQDVYDVTIEHIGGVGDQDIYLHTETNETLNSQYGGWVFVCDGSDWYSASHDQHV